jgi:MFS family permease
MDTTANKDTPITLLGTVIWLMAAIFFFYEFFLRNFIGSIAHQIIPSMSLNAGTFALLGSAYYIAYGIMQIPVGILSDKFGIKKILIAAVLVCTFSTFLFAHSYSLPPALISRFAMGIGSSFAFISLLVITRTWFPKKYFAFFSGMAQFIGTLGPILAGGPLVIFLTTRHQDWRAVLFYVGCFGLLLALAITIIMHQKRKTEKRITQEIKAQRPMKESLIKLAKNKQAWFIALFSGAVYCSIAFLGAIWGTDYLQARGFNQITAASIVSLAWISYAFSCPVLGYISDATKRRKPILIASALIGLMATLAIAYLPTQGKYIYGLLFMGLGLAASGNNIAFAAIAENVDSTTRATAFGLNNAMISVFDTILAPLGGILIATRASSDILHLQAKDFYLGFSVMPTVYCLALVLSVCFIKETNCTSQE